MKKLSVLVALTLVLSLLAPFALEAKAEETITVFNWYDYIDDSVIEQFEEETGIRNLQLNDLICITDHCYRRNGIWHLKHTWWYDMLDDNPIDLVPQIEEDISKAAWVAKSSLPAFLNNTYPSIAEVFREAKV